MPDSGGSAPSGGAAGTGAGQAVGVAVVHSVEPRYPRLSALSGEQGEVWLIVTVNDSGRTAQARVARSSGHERLDEAALDAVRRWRFTRPERAPNGQAEIALHIGFALSAAHPGFEASVLPYEPGRVARINAAARPATGGPTPQQVREALQSLIAGVAGIAANGRDGTFPVPARMTITRLSPALPAQAALDPPPAVKPANTAGAGVLDHSRVLHVTALGAVSHSAAGDFDPSNPADPASQAARWYVYAVEQVNGTSEWLFAVGNGGRIRAVEVMSLGPACTVAPQAACAASGPANPSTLTGH